MLSVDICDDFSAVEDYASTESTGPVGGTITIASGKEYLLKQFKEPALVSFEMEDSAFVDAVQAAFGNALEEIFESKRVSRWPVR